MSTLAETHLRQGRTFLRSGDARRAVELLEKARSLSRGDQQVLRDATAELARAYEQVGDHDRAGRCREQLEFLPSPAAGPAALAGSPGAGVIAAAPSRSRRRMPPWAMVALIALVLALHVGLFVWYRNWRAAKDAAAVTPTATQPALAAPVAPPTTAPVTPTPPPPAPAVAATAPSASLDSLVHDTIGLLVVMGHYEGRMNGQQVSLDVPLSQGTAFVVEPTGVLLTNRHVTDAGKDRRVPAALDKVGMPTVTFRSTNYVVCFGPDRSQRFPATLLHASDKFDLAVLQANHQFASALPFSTHPARLGEKVFAAGYPGVVQEFFDDRYHTRMRFSTGLEKLKANGNVDMLDELFGREAYNATVSRGVVSTAERFIDTVGHVQFDARVSPGNSGGPLLDSDRRVIAIVTKGGTGRAEGYNFGILVDQLRDELAQWVGRKP